jgi:hypothetical protein
MKFLKVLSTPGIRNLRNLMFLELNVIRTPTVEDTLGTDRKSWNHELQLIIFDNTSRTS